MSSGVALPRPAATPRAIALLRPAALLRAVARQLLPALAAAAALSVLIALPAKAQDPPRCDDARLGAVACIAGRLCECRFERGGQMTGLPDMFRWDCSALRPPCGEGILPATPWPPAQSQPGMILLPPRR